MKNIHAHIATADVLETHHTQSFGLETPWPFGLTILALTAVKERDSRTVDLATVAVLSQDQLTQEAILTEYDVPYAVRTAVEAGLPPEIDPRPIKTFGEELGLTENMQAEILNRKITQERNRRITAGFEFQGNTFDFDEVSKSRITGAATLAGFAIGAGALVDDLYWHGGEDPFAWIAQDNTLVTMDAQTCFAFGQAAAEHESLHIFAARALKDAAEPVLDFAEDIHWPGYVPV
ncbi:DUF4376 domain-containing protein [Pseudosulfitobacter sp. DSM 107133]|uniref:DUF4376 domain-containing protein n=1 Tax=Pseudosulfitobacter sp. DSM 107133 TaxID=2883100 RepID=UPI000DF4A00E|nr:DUF4376 domain-containing protein [Pseudosulfitobacter sp. DSM 107133]UOA25891.1 hypothetical protein DSM107133_00580 [Pseudosulfitobacter sp. DSM 107133]